MEDILMRVAVVEATGRSRDELVQMLAAMPGCQVVLCCDCAAAALAVCRPGTVDVILVDIELPGMRGIELVRQLRRQSPELPILIRTVVEDPEVVFAALRAGAIGYVLKGDASGTTETSLRQALAGGSPISSRVARLLIREVHPAYQHSPAVELSPRERHIPRALGILARW